MLGYLIFKIFLKIIESWSLWKVCHQHILKSIYYKAIKMYLDYKFFSNQNQLKDTFDVHHFKLSYAGNFRLHIKNKPSELCKEFVKEVLTLS